MKITRREFNPKSDLAAMAALASASAGDNMHLADLAYRFSSWAMDEPDNIGLWVDERGGLIGWAVMQTPFWTIDYAMGPAADAQFHAQILDWADHRAVAIVDTPSGRPVWFINVFSGQQDRINDLERAGFASQSDVGENSWTKVLMRRDGRVPIEPAAMPAGFTIRPLAGLAEVDAYVALHQAVFESKSMTVDWRQRTLAQSTYEPDLDLVAVAPDGRLAGFCIGWLDPIGTRGQIEPMGVHADFRKLGLGRCLLTEGLRRLQAHGATEFYVETDNYRDEAYLLYESAGYEVAEDVLVFRKDYAPF